MKSTCDMGIHYTGSDKHLCVCAYSDADWANNKEFRRSVSGIMVVINGAPFIIKSKIQQSVALSTAEEEYIALSLCMQEVLRLKSLLCELKSKILQKIKIYEDNQSAIAIAKNDGYQSREKHIDIRYHFIRDHIKDENIVIEYIDSKNQLADFLTKPISTKQFQDWIRLAKIKNCVSWGSVEESRIS